MSESHHKLRAIFTLSSPAERQIIIRVLPSHNFCYVTAVSTITSISKELYIKYTWILSSIYCDIIYITMHFPIRNIFMDTEMGGGGNLYNWQSLLTLLTSCNMQQSYKLKLLSHAPTSKLVNDSWLNTSHTFEYPPQRQTSPMWTSILAMNMKIHSLINLLKPTGHVMHQQV
jgi:hypothetical protein